MSLPHPEHDVPSTPAHEPPGARDADDVERTEAFWHRGMSRATYVRLLRLLFDVPPDGGGGDDRPEGRAA